MVVSRSLLKSVGRLSEGDAVEDDHLAAGGTGVALALETAQSSGDRHRVRTVRASRHRRQADLLHLVLRQLR